MFKFEMTIGWLGNGKVTVETNDFDAIEILKDFVEFQETEGWVHCFDFSTVDYDDEEAEDEEAEDEEAEDETMSGQVVQ
jgi:hypothetical protein